jgi:DNA invertase Pin-like site-specific DNA recombinase
MRQRLGRSSVRSDRHHVENRDQNAPETRCSWLCPREHLRANARRAADRLHAERCAARVYCEKASGARPDRRELLKLLKALAPDDVVTMTRINRLARSTFDLSAIVKGIVDAGGQFQSMAEPWADASTSTGA